MKKLILIAFIVSILTASPAIAAIGGHTLRYYCKDAVKYIENQKDPTITKTNYKKCFAVVAETLEKGNGELYCIPPEKTYAELILIVMGFLDENTELLVHESTSLINEIAMRTFPCPEPSSENENPATNSEK